MEERKLKASWEFQSVRYRQLTARPPMMGQKKWGCYKKPNAEKLGVWEMEGCRA